MLTGLARALRADEQATDPAGWALNLATFRIVYLGLGGLLAYLEGNDYRLRVSRTFGTRKPALFRRRPPRRARGVTRLRLLLRPVKSPRVAI